MENKIRSEHMSHDEVAARLGMGNKYTFWRWYKLKKFPAPVKIGNRHFWPRKEIEKFIKNLGKA